MISATRLFVGNLPENTEEKELYSAFSHFGEITSVDLKCKPGDTKESKKFAFVSLSADNGNVESCKLTSVKFLMHIHIICNIKTIPIPYLDASPSPNLNTRSISINDSSANFPGVSS